MITIKIETLLIGVLVVAIILLLASNIFSYVSSALASSAFWIGAFLFALIIIIVIVIVVRLQ